MKKIIGFLIISIILSANIYAENPIDDKVNFLPEDEKAEYLFDRGLGYYNLNQYSNAIEFLKQALNIYLNKNDKTNTKNDIRKDV